MDIYDGGFKMTFKDEMVQPDLKEKYYSFVKMISTMNHMDTRGGAFTPNVLQNMQQNKINNMHN